MIKNKLPKKEIEKYIEKNDIINKQYQNIVKKKNYLLMKKKIKIYMNMIISYLN